MLEQPTYKLEWEMTGLDIWATKPRALATSSSMLTFGGTLPMGSAK